MNIIQLSYAMLHLPAEYYDYHFITRQMKSKISC